MSNQSEEIDEIETVEPDVINNEEYLRTVAFEPKRNSQFLFDNPRRYFAIVVVASFESRRKQSQTLSTQYTHTIDLQIKSIEWLSDSCICREEHRFGTIQSIFSVRLGLSWVASDVWR